MHVSRLQMARQAYEAFYKLPPDSSTRAQLERSSAGVEGWSHFAGFVEQATKQGVLQRELLEKTGMIRTIEEQVRCRSSMPKYGLRFGVLLCETEESGVEVNLNEDWCDVEFEVALDSGSQDHVCDEADTPGYVMEASPGSDRGQCFVVGNGGRLPNMGQKVLNLEPEADESMKLKSCFQIARVTRPLMSVGKICDSGMKVELTDKTATVMAPDGTTVCVLTRKPGGLYICKMRLKQPFPRQG